MLRKKPRNRFWTEFLPVAVLLLGCAGVLCAAEDSAVKTVAQEILDTTGVRGGLIVHVGCGDGKLTAALRATDSSLVHGLDTDATNVEKARDFIQSRGLYGTVSVERWTGGRLPYADNLVNLLVVEDRGELPEKELMRVLCPGGVAYIKEDGKWAKTVKPWPETIDEWSHFLHDASNNAVAKDSEVGPPQRMKWFCGPLWTRSHEYNSSISAMVSAGGRIFYIVDEGLTGVTTQTLPDRWTLVARDAFNGVLLWKKPIEKWFGGRSLRGIPPETRRRLVAEGDRVFITIGAKGPVSAIDAAIGEVITEYKGTDGTKEIRCLDGILLLRGPKGLSAVDSKTGKQLWQRANVSPLNFAAADGRVFLTQGENVVCVGLKDGKELWQIPCNDVAMILVHDGRVVLGGKRRRQTVDAETGKTLWKGLGGVGRGLFITGDRIWSFQGEQVAAWDLKTGKQVETIGGDDVFTPGHHPRCYESKCTEKYLITPYRGAEFISLTGGKNSQHDWTRGPCKFGIMPANGLLYVPPNPCFCYPGVKLLGFNALAPAADKSTKTPKLTAKQRLEHGPAFGKVSKSPAPSPDDWPTYRHDPRRTGATTSKVPAKVSPKWKVNLKGRLTPPVVAGDRVYVAAKDAHTLHALNIKDGSKLWHFTAGGRIDSPPTIFGNLVLFGCVDGRVYCLRAVDGELVWRFTAGPYDQRIVAFSQLESPWRVHGSILIKDGVAYGTAGRSTYLDGGIRVFGLDPKTGKVLHETCLDTWTRTREDAVGKPFIAGYHIEGALSDILVSEGDYIYLGQYKLDRKLVEQEVPYVMPGPDEKSKAMGLAELIEQPYVRGVQSQKRNEKVQHDWQWRVQKGLMEEYTKKYGGASMGDRKMGRHVLTMSGFLDDTWYNRTFWMYGETWPGFHIANLASKTGQLLSVGEKNTYAVQAYASRNLQSPLFAPTKDNYLLYADDNDNEPVIPDYTRGVPKGVGFTRQRPPVWFDWVPIRMRAMVLAGDHLFVAGPPNVVDPDDPMAAFEGRKGAVLQARSAADGKTLAELKLDYPPVFDGLIAAGGRLFLCTTNGDVICFGAKK